MATDPIRLADLHGLPIEINTDHDGITVTVGGQTAVLGPAQRAAFTVAVMAADIEADAYAEAHGSDFDA